MFLLLMSNLILLWLENKIYDLNLLKYLKLILWPRIRSILVGVGQSWLIVVFFFFYLFMRDTQRRCITFEKYYQPGSPGGSEG